MFLQEERARQRDERHREAEAQEPALQREAEGCWRNAEAKEAEHQCELEIQKRELIDKYDVKADLNHFRPVFLFCFMQMSNTIGIM